MKRPHRLALAVLLALAPATAGIAIQPAWSVEATSPEWRATLEAAKGQEVQFNAWGGSPNINDYIAWAGGIVKERYGITLNHVKLEDTATAVSAVVAEKAAGRLDDGSVDLVWINGENFASLKEQGLLADGFSTELPNWRYVDTANPGATTDFTLPIDGQESPWGRAKLVFFYDSARTDAASLPRSTADLLTYAKAHPGRLSYPTPPDFVGSSFLKQVLLEQVADRNVLARPVDESSFAAVTAPLWTYLDTLNPLLWRAGRDFPANYPAMKQLLADGELDIIFAFNPGEASAAIAAGELPETVRSFTFPGGTLGNTHYVAIPFNSGSKAAAKVVADFLLSPEAQLRKEDPAHWGDPTVLDMAKLPEADRAAFAALDLGPATLRASELGPAFPEPHPSWMTRLEAEWTKRYGTGR